MRLAMHASDVDETSTLIVVTTAILSLRRQVLPRVLFKNCSEQLLNYFC